MYNRDEIGKRIKSARQEKHLSQMQFAELINVSTPYLSDIENGKTNLALKDVNGELLLISQFTLYADCKKGNRPSFIKAGNPELANSLYEYIIAACKKELPVVETGSFGADMKVSLENDGPFTVIFDESLRG